MLSKTIVLITDNLLLTKAIEENHLLDDLISSSDVTVHIISNDDYFPLPSKVDLLILDSNDFRFIEPYRVKTIINLSSNQYFSNSQSNEIKINKPFRLNKLLQLIENALQSSDLFCAINKNYLYNERLQTLTSATEVVKFTEKENHIFKAMLLENNFEITKDSLLKNIWRYHEDSETSTVDTHLYKLKAKLPAGMLEIKNNICRLSVGEI